MVRHGFPPFPRSSPQRRLVLSNNSPPISTHPAVIKNIEYETAQDVLDAVAKILYAEITSHAQKEALTREQSGYLVGWHDALHAIRYLADKIDGFATDGREHAIVGVPSIPSFPDSASIEGATELIMVRGPKFMREHEHRARPIPGGTLFGPGPARSRYPEATTGTTCSSSNPIDTPSSANISSSIGDLLYDEQPTVHHPKNHLHASGVLRNIPTLNLIRLYEREARLSEHKILAELARSRLIRQAILQDRFFGNVPAFPPPATDDGSDFYLFGDDVNQFLVSEAQEARTLGDVKQTFRDWRRDDEASAIGEPLRAGVGAPSGGFFGGSVGNDAGGSTTPLAPPPLKWNSPQQRKYTFLSEESRTPSPEREVSPFRTVVRSKTPAVRKTESSTWYIRNSSTSPASDFSSSEHQQETEKLDALAEHLSVDDGPAPSSTSRRSGDSTKSKPAQTPRKPQPLKKQNPTPAEAALDYIRLRRIPQHASAAHFTAPNQPKKTNYSWHHPNQRAAAASPDDVDQLIETSGGSWETNGASYDDDQCWRAVTEEAQEGDLDRAHQDEDLGRDQWGLGIELTGATLKDSKQGRVSETDQWSQW
ncbi:hypothetical protein CPLU01_04527 [Colletotrichum plurivorum]|uniref:Uncharacterized protein n=1 Tax=Colletotrichum plurivorum TaxID=2175906 RepID=A0A8H6KP21_9PEZI|nr:hypothetical protein CPLU01_04527 [Colletotrichum plurivorum]